MASGPSNGMPAESPTPDFTNFDFEAAAKKLNCNPDQDSIWNTIDILQNHVVELKKQVKFFEDLFGYQAEYLMCFKRGEIKKLDNIIFMGQQKLEGKALQEYFQQKTGYTRSLESLTGKSVIEEIEEAHYDFAVVLPMGAKMALDHYIRRESLVPTPLSDEDKYATLTDRLEAMRVQYQATQAARILEATVNPDSEAKYATLTAKLVAQQEAYDTEQAARTLIAMSKGDAALGNAMPPQAENPVDHEAEQAARILMAMSKEDAALGNAMRLQAENPVSLGPAAAAQNTPAKKKAVGSQAARTLMAMSKEGAALGNAMPPQAENPVDHEAEEAARILMAMCKEDAALGDFIRRQAENPVSLGPAAAAQNTPAKKKKKAVGSQAASADTVRAPERSATAKAPVVPGNAQKRKPPVVVISDDEDDDDMGKERAKTSKNNGNGNGNGNQRFRTTNSRWNAR